MRLCPAWLLIAVLAVTSWAPTGAFAHDGGHPSGGSGPEESEVVEGNFYPVDEAGSGIFGSAKLIRRATGTELLMHASGLKREEAYPVHLHVGGCGEMGPHYRDDPAGAPGPPNELWPTSDPDGPDEDVTADDNGYANARGTADWRARPEARSVMIHEGDSGRMLACADLH